MYLEILNYLSQIWAYNSFNTFGIFSFFISLLLLLFFFIIIYFLSSLLVRIYFSLPFKVHEFLFILGLVIQQRGPRLGNLILTCKMLDAKSIAYLLP